VFAPELELEGNTEADLEADLDAVFDTDLDAFFDFALPLDNDLFFFFLNFF